MDNNQRKRTMNILYGVIGIATLMIATVGATFAYFTATQSVGGNNITGNMATVSFNLSVQKKSTADDTKGGLIPMTNSMVQKAVSNASTKGICIDDNNNAVCQVYKITVNNTSSAGIFLDGYVTLTGGSGTSTDYTSATTTMRWAQAFCTESNGNLSSCTTAGTATVRQTNASGFTWTALGSNASSGHDTAEIKDSMSAVVGTATIANNGYPAIKTNYIRVSKHTGTRYEQDTDVTSALVYNQFLNANDKNSNNNAGDSSTNYTDSQIYYFVVWLSENGLNQTAGSGGSSVPATGLNFFQGLVTFISSQGSEVTATFNGYTAVTPDTN